MRKLRINIGIETCTLLKFHLKKDIKEILLQVPSALTCMNLYTQHNRGRKYHHYSI